MYRAAVGANKTKTGGPDNSRHSKAGSHFWHFRLQTGQCLLSHLRQRGGSPRGQNPVQGCVTGLRYLLNLERILDIKKQIWMHSWCCRNSGMQCLLVLAICPLVLPSPLLSSHWALEPWCSPPFAGTFTFLHIPFYFLPVPSTFTVTFFTVRPTFNFTFCPSHLLLL